jgi:hypothetical protein
LRFLRADFLVEVVAGFDGYALGVVADSKNGLGINRTRDDGVAAEAELASPSTRT